MDFVRLVENGAYKKDDLNELNREFIKGMEFVMNNVLNDSLFDEGDFESFSPTLEKIQNEIADEVMTTIKEYVYVTICETIVELIDGQGAAQ